MNTVQRIAKNTGVLLASQVISRLLGFFYIMYTARYLGAEGFGILSFALAFTGIFGVFTDLGLGPLTIREIARDKSLAGKYLGNVSVMKVILVIITFGLIVLVINLLGYPEQTIKVVYCIALSVIFGAFTGMLNSIFQAFERMEYVSLGQILKSVLMLGGVIFAIKQGFGVIGFASLYLIASIIVLGYSVVISRWKFTSPTLIGTRWKMGIDRSFWKPTIKEALPFGLSAIFVTVYFWIDSVMLSLMKGNEAVGLYNAAYRLVYILLFIPGTYFAAIYPIMSKWYKSSGGSLKLAYKRSFRYMLTIALPIGVGTTLLADRIITSLYGTEYTPAIIALRILIWAVFFSYLSYTPMYTLNSINRQRIYTYVVSLCMIVNVMLNLIFIPQLSYIGASIVTVATELLAFMLLFYYVIHLLGNPLSYRFVVKIGIGVLVMGTFIVFCSDFMKLSLLILISTVIYLLSILLLHTFPKDEILILRKLVTLSNRGINNTLSPKTKDQDLNRNPSGDTKDINNMTELEFTGERVVPNKTPYGIYQEHVNRYAFASKFIKDKIVLDVACGTGYGAAYLLRKGARKVVGLDISMDAITYAKERYNNRGLSLVQSNATSLPFSDNYFDVIVSFETIEHLKEYNKFLSECKRVLKSGGLFICSTPNKRISSPYSEQPLNRFHVREFYPEEFLSLLAEYFANIRLYGQHDINVIEKGIRQLASRALSIIPGGEAIKNLAKRVISNQNSFIKDSNVPEREISEQTLDGNYRVHKFNNNLIKAPAYIIAIAEKRVEG